MTSLARWATDAAASFPSTVILRRATMSTSHRPLCTICARGLGPGSANVGLTAGISCGGNGPAGVSCARGGVLLLLLLDVVLQPGDVDFLVLPLVLLGRQPTAPVIQRGGALLGQLLAVAIEAVLDLEARRLGLFLHVGGGGGDPGPAEPQAEDRRHCPTDLRILLHALHLF